MDLTDIFCLTVNSNNKYNNRYPEPLISLPHSRHFHTAAVLYKYEKWRILCINI